MWPALTQNVIVCIGLNGPRCKNMCVIFTFKRCEHDFGDSTRFGHGTKIHNSVIWLNWITFGSKIIIHVKLCVYMIKALTFLGVNIFPVIFKYAPPKSGPFSDFDIKGLQKRPYNISQQVHRQKFQKCQRTFSVLRLNWRIIWRNCISSWYPRRPNHLIETVPKRANNDFYFFWLGHRGYWNEVQFLWLGLYVA